MTTSDPTIDTPVRLALAQPDASACVANARTVLIATELGQVVPLLREVERRALSGERWWGYLAYEAAAALDGALTTQSPTAGGPPLAVFLTVEEGNPLQPGPWWIGPLRAEAGRRGYTERVERIRREIALGTTYQVNLTLRLRARFEGDPLGLLVALAAAQRVQAIGLDLGDFVIASASPELFLRRRGSRLEARPMKGTAARGADGDQDRRFAAQLRASVKERAENLMIVDMLRNDLGRVAVPGTVVVPSLFELERYPTVWQMTSRVEAESNADLISVLAATFPCASVTGAPKVSTMELIRELELSPRGVYTGLIGSLGPGRDFDFNVAIRTATIDRGRGRLEYGVGSGITWDSRPAAEHRECLAKARVATAVAAADLELVETLRVSPVSGPLRLPRHLARMQASALRLGFEWPGGVEQRVRDMLGFQPPLPSAPTRPPTPDPRTPIPVRSEVDTGTLRTGGESPRRLRLLLSRRGALRWELAAAPPREREPVRLALAVAPVPELAWSLFHKTTERTIYDRLRHNTFAVQPDAAEVLLWSEEVGITETTIANVLYRLGGRWWTPPADGHLLPGILRTVLVERGRVGERPLHLDELTLVESWVLASSLRGLRPAVLAPRQLTLR